MNLLTKERHFSVGALWASIGIIVIVITTQILRDHVPAPTRILGTLVIVAWVFFWFGSDKTANVVYRLVDVLSKRGKAKR